MKDMDWGKLRLQLFDAGYKYIIGTNAAYKTGICNCLIFGDKKFYDWNKKEIGSLLISVIAVNDTLDDPMIHTVRRRNIGWETDREKRQLVWNSNSGAAAVNLAYFLGAKEILLLGFDMRLVDGENNYHDWHKRPKFVPKFAKFISRFTYVAKGCEEAGIKVVNATPGSKLPYFPIMCIEEALKNEYLVCS